MVATPDGKPVAMVHVNTCTSDLDAWVKLFAQLLEAAGANLTKAQLYDMLYFQALEGDADCGGLVSYNCYSGEPVTGLEEGRPLAGAPAGEQADSAQLHAGPAVRSHGHAANRHGAAVGRGRPGGEALRPRRPVQDQGRGPAAAGGRFGRAGGCDGDRRRGRPLGHGPAGCLPEEPRPGETLPQYLEQRVFAGAAGDCVEPNPADREGFQRYIARYRAGLAVEKEAGKALQ